MTEVFEHNEREWEVHCAHITPLHSTTRHTRPRRDRRTLFCIVSLLCVAYANGRVRRAKREHNIRSHFVVAAPRDRRSLSWQPQQRAQQAAFWTKVRNRRTLSQSQPIQPSSSEQLSSARTLLHSQFALFDTSCLQSRSLDFNLIRVFPSGVSTF